MFEKLSTIQYIIVSEEGLSKKFVLSAIHGLFDMQRLCMKSCIRICSLRPFTYMASFICV